MARASGRDGERSSGATPGRLPDVTPASAPYTADFTFQAIMDLQKTVAVLVEKVDRLSSEIKDTADKVDTLRHWQARLLGAGLVIAFLWSIAMIIPWDRIKLEPEAPPAKNKSAN